MIYFVRQIHFNVRSSTLNNYPSACLQWEVWTLGHSGGVQGPGNGMEGDRRMGLTHPEKDPLYHMEKDSLDHPEKDCLYHPHTEKGRLYHPEKGHLYPGT